MNMALTLSKAMLTTYPYPRILCQRVPLMLKKMAAPKIMASVALIVCKYDKNVSIQVLYFLCRRSTPPVVGYFDGLPCEK